MRNKRYNNKNKKPFKGNNYKKTNNFNNAEKNLIKTPKINLREDQVGITEFVSNGVGFTGVLKSRYSDFHVNEIDLNDKALKLDNLDIPKTDAINKLNTDEINGAKEELKNVITDEIWEKISALAESTNSNNENENILIDVSNVDKIQRTQIHNVLKNLYAGKLVSTTINLETTNNETEPNTETNSSRKYLKVMQSSGKRERMRWNFPGVFVHFIVHKENIDTSEVAAAMADRMKLHPSQVNYCGIKDKRAKTTQKFCIKKRPPSQIVGSVKSLRNVRVGNFEFSDQVLKLGDLKGNRFRIALRHLKGDLDKIKCSLEELSKNGFINYFGLQRFGQCASAPTYEVGAALLKSDYKLACELILKPRDNDVYIMRSIRETWWKNRDSAAAVSMFPNNNNFIEKKILEGLANYGENDYASALRKIPRNMLLLYPHAFQSLIFNRIASKRIKEFGLKLVPGDLVYREKNELDIDTTSFDVDDNGNNDLEFQTEELESNKQQDDTNVSIFKRKVKALTEEDIASGNYTLFDVVLPLPGYDISYPENDMSDWYEDILKEYGLTSATLRHNVRTYTLAGAYRKLLIKPANMSWEFCSYNSAESVLITSDWEQLNGIKETGKLPYESDGKYKALLLEFYLPCSCYATMLVRELLKSDTSASHQTKLEQEELKNTNDDGVINTEQNAKKRCATNVDDENNEHKKLKTCEDA